MIVLAYKKIYKLCSLLGVGFMAAAIATGCIGDTSNKTVKIGANLEMTGTNASFGNSAANGINMAVKEINAKGGVLGKQLELIVADNRSEVSESVNITQKLLSEKVIAIVGPSTSSGMISAGEVSAQANVLAISPSATNPNATIDPATGKVRPYAFRAAFIDTFQGRIMADFAIKKLQSKRAAIFIDNSNEYAKGLAKYFKDTFKAQGGDVVAEEAYLQKDTDFRSLLTKVQATKPDVIFAPGYYQEVGLLINQARKMGISTPFLGGDGWDSVKLVEIAGAENMHDTYFCTHYSPSDTTPRLKAFMDKYKEWYGVEPDSYALLAYDSTYMVVEAIKNAGTADSAKVRDAMEKLNKFDGASGVITIDQNHDAISSGIIMAYENGVPVFKERIEP